MKNFKRLFLSILLLLTGLTLLFLQPIKDYIISTQQQQFSLKHINREQIIANQQRQVTYHFDDVKPIDPFTVLKNTLNPLDLPVIGGIAIPSLEINLPIYYGITEEGMYLGASTLSPTQKMGESNYPLASHHSINPKMLFAPLLHIQKGASIYLTDLETIYEYQVNQLETVDPHRLDVLNPTTTPTITLITCDQTLENRYIVKGQLVNTIPYKQAPKELLAYFDRDITIPE